MSGRLADAATAAAIVLLLLWANGVAALVPGLPSSRTANALLFAFAVAALAAGFAAGRSRGSGR